jgi:beta-N-acetylhexosaminidase
VAARSVTIVKDEAVVPLDPEKAGKVLLAARSYAEDFFKAGRAAYPSAETYRYTLSGGYDLVRRAQRADTVIFCISSEEDLKPLGALRDLGPRVVVFSVLNPGYLDSALWADGALAVYSYAAPSFVAGFSALLGRIPGPGVLPFSLGESRGTSP